MDSFKNMVPQTALVLRNGGQLSVPSENLCIGDVVLVKGGDRLPGDLRVIECKSFKVIVLYQIICLFICLFV